ncbi:cytidine deaminase [Sphaerisporangium krabiense]|uniref:Cytidine deaminase n=1 Tax=Sphaerisporangium krabiense TaxID=763782 RepID=A0A7W9DRM1_9ACTN|nr:cytidine deaminase [Sphaerisporangium krabiense]MBB5628792.1 cytidine deaminase [Sphaerisporangium krabiense]
MTETSLAPEDSKIITLARAARARNGTAEGAAVRDETGRTYTATNVDLPSLKLSAVQVAVAMAVSSGAVSLEAAALVTDEDEPGRPDLAAIEDLGEAVLFLAAPDGAVKGRYI